MNLREKQLGKREETFRKYTIRNRKKAIGVNNDKKIYTKEKK